MDNELPPSAPEIEKTHSINPKLFILGTVLLLLIMGGGLFIFISGLRSPSTPPPPVTQQQTSSIVSKNYQSSYLHKATSIKAPDFLTTESLIISGDRLNGVVVKENDPHHFLVESKDDNSQNQTIPVVTDPQTVFYLSKPSNTPPDGPFSGIKLPGDYSSSIKELSTYTIQFNVISQATDSASLPWVKDNSGSYIAKSVLLYEK